MSNPIIPKQQPNISQLFEEFKKNPMQYLSGMPANVNTPKQAVEYLANNGRIPPQLRGQVSAMLGRQI